MTSDLGATVKRQMSSLDPRRADYVVSLVDLLISQAASAGSSDMHLHPADAGLEVRWRIDGVLHKVETLPSAIAPNVVARLKVMAGLLTYRSDLPQEGRIAGATATGIERRVSTFPTLHGERVVVRLFADTGRYQRLAELGLPAPVAGALASMLQETTGAALIVGPAGSGKTTTLYACLREVLDHSSGTRSVVSLEDPIEVAVPGVSQSQVNPAAGFDLARGLKSLVRQDPEVIAIGEIRDPESAATAFEAALTGQLVLSTFHAGSAAEAIGRLLDMGLEPYVLRSGLKAVLYQRLVRRLCVCARPLTDTADWLGLPVRQANGPGGCESCHGSGYHGRMLLSEWLEPTASPVARALMERADVATLEQAAIDAGMILRWTRAVEAVEAADTSPAEVRRVLGLGGKSQDRSAR
jgi:type II secretory ATPase GspE/PulE/Tfp pilus assembly ATPase PilB-like protein